MLFCASFSVHAGTGQIPLKFFRMICVDTVQLC
jgi:hypothetical protein